MPIYSVQAPDGKVYDIEGPEGATADQLGAVIQQNAASVDSTPKRNPYPVDPGVASLMNVGQGVTFGFGDEIAGLLGADKQRYRDTLQNFEESYPKSALLGKISGNMLVPFGAGKAAASMAAHPWLTAATVGGIGGALQNAGDAPTMVDIPHDASMGLITGMGVAPLAMLGTTAGGSVLSALGNQVGSRIPYLSGDISDYLARNRIAKALERDKIDAPVLSNKLAELGPEAKLADAAGESTRAVLDLNASLPGQTKDALETAIKFRQAGRPDRLNVISDSIGNNQGRAGVVNSVWQQQKLTASAPLYKAFEAKPVIADQHLQDLMNIADRQNLFKPASVLADFEQRPFSLTSGRTPGTYNPADLNYVKQAIDAQISKAVKNEDANLQRVLIAYKNDFISSVDKLSGGKYKPALDAYSGPASMQSALDNGRNAMTMSAEQIGDLLSSMSQAEKDAFRIGAAESFRTKAGSPTGQSELMNVYKNRNLQERLQAIFENKQKYDEAIKVLNNEDELRKLEKLGRGSQTFARTAAAEDQTKGVAGDVADALVKVKAGMWPQLLGGVKQYSAQLGTPEPVRDSIGKILLGRSPIEVDAIYSAQQAARRRALSNALSTGTAAVQAANQVR